MTTAILLTEICEENSYLVSMVIINTQIALLHFSLIRWERDIVVNNIDTR